MGGDAGRWALLWVPFLGTLAAGNETGHPHDGFGGDDLLSRLGRTAWDSLEGWLGPQSLRLVAEVSDDPPHTHLPRATPGDLAAAGSRGRFVPPPALPAEPLRHPLARLLGDLGGLDRALRAPG